MPLSHDVCPILTAFRKIQLPDDYYSEIEFLFALEVRLLATVDAGCDQLGDRVLCPA